MQWPFQSVEPGRLGWSGDAADERSSGTVQELLTSAFLPSPWSRVRPWTLEG